MNLNNQIGWSDTDRIVSNDTRTYLDRAAHTTARTITPPVSSFPAETVACTTLDRATHMTPQTTLFPDSTLPAETTSRCGLTVSSRSATGVTATCAYDALGRQVSQADGRGNTSQIVYDGYQQVADNAGNAYAWDCTESVATRPLTWFNSAIDTPHSALYYIHDGNKNVSEVLGSDGSIVAHYEYAPFGAVTKHRGESAAMNPGRFSSEYAEEDIMTIYYNYRHYEPVMGRWQMPFQTCRDRAKEAIGDCCLKVGRKTDATTRGVLKVEFYK